MPDTTRGADPHPDQGQAEADGAPVVALQVSHEAEIDLARVPAVFGAEAAEWLGQATGRDAAGFDTYLCDLELRVSPERRTAFKKSAIVSVGVPRQVGSSWIVPIEWRAATMAPLFPVFAGRLEITAAEVTLDGHYAPPFGLVGYVMDRGVLGIVGRGTARWFLAKAAAALAPR
jgi:hypothetical protein